MTERLSEIVSRYGQEATLIRDGAETPIRAFIQPSADRNRLEDAADVLGRGDERLYVYLGRTAVEPGDVLVWQGLRLRVRTSSPYYVGRELSHYWAALRMEWEAAV
ncbi:hypothetical protein H8790_09575 [Oscillibacter hominis]|uniref:Uncharacterized protein n=1 Tax=Oscillibacter hominis TaxID=2763056 RepID=A0A7G9B2D4_9FIRM|nr:hypothetical protein [Oscillibacter hominis]QNL43715.1 hypothetical protein H8790_09575 [Oscillibacter hominis]